jgi:dihydrofolate reductase
MRNTDGFDCSETSRSEIDLGLLGEGRKTYEVAVKSGTTAYPGVKNYVFSRTMKASPDERVEIVADDAARFVRRLKRKSGKAICVMGGGELGCSLLDAGVIDEVGLNVHPVLLGEGIPLFHAMRRQLTSTCWSAGRSGTAACVLVRYRVQKVLPRQQAEGLITDDAFQRILRERAEKRRNVEQILQQARRRLADREGVRRAARSLAERMQSIAANLETAPFAARRAILEAVVPDAKGFGVYVGPGHVVQIRGALDVSAESTASAEAVPFRKAISYRR